MTTLTPKIRQDLIKALDQETDRFDVIDPDGHTFLGTDTIKSALARLADGPLPIVSDSAIEWAGSYYSRGALRTPEYDPTDVEIVSCVIDFFGLDQTTDRSESPDRPGDVEIYELDLTDDELDSAQASSDSPLSVHLSDDQIAEAKRILES